MNAHLKYLSYVVRLKMRDGLREWTEDSRYFGPLVSTGTHGESHEHF